MQVGLLVPYFIWYPSEDGKSVEVITDDWFLFLVFKRFTETERILSLEKVNLSATSVYTREFTEAWSHEARWTIGIRDDYSGVERRTESVWIQYMVQREQRMGGRDAAGKRQHLWSKFLIRTQIVASERFRCRKLTCTRHCRNDMLKRRNNRFCNIQRGYNRFGQVSTLFSCIYQHIPRITCLGSPSHIGANLAFRWRQWREKTSLLVKPL